MLKRRNNNRAGTVPVFIWTPDYGFITHFSILRVTRYYNRRRTLRTHTTWKQTDEATAGGQLRSYSQLCVKMFNQLPLPTPRSHVIKTLPLLTPFHRHIELQVSVCYLHRHVVNVQAEGDSLVKSQLRLSGPVDVHRLFWLDEAFLVVDARLDHSVTDRLNHTHTDLIRTAAVLHISDPCWWLVLVERLVYLLCFTVNVSPLRANKYVCVHLLCVWPLLTERNTGLHTVYHQDLELGAACAMFLPPEYCQSTTTTNIDLS